MAPLLAAALVVTGVLADLAGIGLGIADLATLAVAPGLVLIPLLPAALRRSAVGTLAAVPVLGGGLMLCLLITTSYAGLPISAPSVRGLALAVVVAGWAALWRRSRDEEARPEWTLVEGIGLPVALAVGGFLGLRIVGDVPVPGNDWAKYVLYADEIRREGALLIDNPFWLLGVPFREDPGVPALYGAYLELTGAPAGQLARGILVLLLAGVATTFACARVVGGPVAAVLAAGLVAALPITHDMLGWHGLANEGALALMPLALMYAAELAQGRLGARQAAGFGLVVVALAATHRLSFIVTGLALALTAAAALAWSGRRRTAIALGRTGLAVLVLGVGVALDLYARQRTFGGTLPAEDYLSTKLDIRLTLRDLSAPFAVAAALGLAALAVRRVRRPALLPAVLLFAVALGLAFAWVVGLPLVYLRMAYYLPLGLAIVVATVVAVLLRPPVALAGGAALVAAIAVLAAGQSDNVRTFYGFANPSSLRGLDAVAADLRPREPVVTDRCWSFLATWLLRTPTLPALARQDIQPASELPGALVAAAVIRGSPAALRYVRSLGTRYVLVDPFCVDGQGRPLPPPAVGNVVFQSPRLVILRLPETPSGLPGEG